MKIVTSVGARPQFTKTAPVTRAIQQHNREMAGTRIMGLSMVRELKKRYPKQKSVIVGKEPTLGSYRHKSLATWEETIYA
ncbi:MAG: hypothetical protein ABGX83_07565 [Nitrospira sp.]|nr:hypothetical protein [Candidatus Manganitrophaceae bacterium]HIL35447.1 hypothetical protein [Candidatus Manganitrophaceae bacterium]